MENQEAVSTAPNTVQASQTRSRGREKKSGEIYDLDPNQVEFEAGLNRRQKYTEIEELAESMHQFGQMIPALVFKARSGEQQGKYLVRAGHRRTLAARYIVENLDPNFKLRAIKMKNNDYVENLLLQVTTQSEVPFNDLEKGMLILELQKEGLKSQSIQSAIGISQPQMYNLLSLTKLTDAVKDAVINEQISTPALNEVVRMNSEGRGKDRVVDLESIENTVFSLIEDAQNSPSTGKKGAKVTGANVNKASRKPNLVSKIKTLRQELSKINELSPKAASFLEVLDQLADEDVSIEEVVSSMNS